MSAMPAGDVQSGLALHAERLQRIGILRTADEEIAAEADADRGIGADAAIIAGKIAAADRPVGAFTAQASRTWSVKPRSTP